MKQLLSNSNLPLLLGQHMTQYGWRMSRKRPL